MEVFMVCISTLADKVGEQYKQGALTRERLQQLVYAAVRGTGVTNTSNVRRITADLRSELGKRGGRARAAALPQKAVRAFSEVD
jgi:hypothetical protein